MDLERLDTGDLLAEAERLGLVLELADGRVHVRAIASARAQAVALALRPRAEEVRAALTERQRPVDVLAAFAAQAARHPSAPAVSDGAARLTYAELMADARGLAAQLLAAGCRPETRVGIAADRSCRWVAAVLGVMLAGGAYVPLGAALPGERIGEMCRDGDVEMLIGDPQRLDDLPEFETMFTPKLALDARADAGSHAAAEIPAAGAPGRLAYVLTTSGSSGRPKQVMVDHGALGNLVAWHNRSYALEAGCRSTQVAAMSFDAHVWELFPPLCAGAELVIVQPEAMLDFPRFADWIGARAITHMFLPTPVAEGFLAVARDRLPASLRYLLVGGDVLRTPVDLSRPVVVNHYGPTEAAVVSTASRAVGEPDPPIGRAIANTRADVLDPWLQPVGGDVVGEIWLGGAHLARGYARDPRATALAFLPDPRGGGTRLYRTGDLGARRDDGEIRFRGRVDDQIKVRGIRIEPGEIERAMLAHPDVAEAAVVRHRDGDVLVGFCALSPPAEPSTREEMAGWRDLYDATYAAAAAQDDEFVGWQATADGRPIPVDEMRRWAEETAERIVALGGRRVLEVGVGTGILLHRLLAAADRYVACDLAPQALARVRARLADLPPSEAAKVELVVASADDLSPVRETGFDVIVLNSVSQYLLGGHTMRQVLDELADRLAPDGAIFVGDVRDLRLLPAFELSVATARAGPAASGEAVEKQRRIVALEGHELLLTPDFFRAWAGERGFHAVSSPKPMSFDNELSRYRFDVVLRPGTTPGDPAGSTLDWATADPAAVPGANDPDTVLIGDIPMGTVADELARATGDDDGAIVPPSTPDGALAALAWPGWESRAVLDGERPGRFAVQLRRGGAGWPAPRASAAFTPSANDPVARRDMARAVERLREVLRATLPAYQLPDVIQSLPRLPLTANGKIDRKALAALPVARASGGYVAPETALEDLLAGWFADNLGTARIGREDNLYELGANSLAAARVSAHFNAVTGIDLRIDTVLESQTVAELAARIEALVGGREAAAEIMAIVNEPA